MSPQIAIPLYRPTDAEQAFEEWGANCGPAAMAAICGMQLSEIRKHMPNFPGYTTPSIVLQTLRSAGLKCDYGVERQWPLRGLVCIQFGGPWMEKGAHWAEPYKRTHYIGVMYDAVYDVNCDGWGTRAEWEAEIAPWLGGFHKKWDGTWFARSCVVVTSPPAATGRHATL